MYLTALMNHSDLLRFTTEVVPRISPRSPSSEKASHLTGILTTDIDKGLKFILQPSEKKGIILWGWELILVI